MTIADLLRDSCKTAAQMTRRGRKITVKKGDKPLFQIVPLKSYEVTMTPKEYKSFVNDVNALAEGFDPDENPIINTRHKRRL